MSVKAETRSPQNNAIKSGVADVDNTNSKVQTKETEQSRPKKEQITCDIRKVKNN